jgi:probable metal-binding protein
MNDTTPAASATRIHGHDVMQMLVDADRPLTRAELEAAVLAKFGPAARFHTCSAEDMTAGQLIAFLDAKGKFIEADGKVSTEASRICKH